MGPILQLWVPSFLFAHALTIIWLVRAYLLTRSKPSSKPQHQPGAVHPPEPVDAHQSSSAATAEDLSDVCIHVKEGPHRLTASSVVAARTSEGEPSLVDASKVPKQLDSEVAALAWQAIGCSYSIRGQTKVVLRDVWGQAHPGQMQALIGPSGAGKSTLMDILAMRKSVGQLSGCLLVNGQPATASFIQHTSYVPQEDTFIPTMFAEETLSFYAQVTLGSGYDRSSRRQRVQQVLAAVGLTQAASTLVGGALPGGLSVRGLSGGERRRLSIAAGILAAPSVLFLDEPTSGLDSFAALSVMGHLQHVSRTTHQTVIATIHQPRNAIWEMFDMVSLLASGRLMFHGRCSDMVPWFQGLGYPYDNRGGESDWVLDLVAIGFDKPCGIFPQTLRTLDDVNAAADAFAKQRRKGSMAVLCVAQGPSSSDGGGEGQPDAQLTCEAHQPLEAASGSALQSSDTTGCGSSQRHLSYPTSWWPQFTALYGRELATMTRNPFDVPARLLMAAYLAVLYGVFAYNMEFKGFQGFNTVVNILYSGAVMLMLVPYVSISIYTADKQIYMAESGAGRYRPSAYYAAKVLCSAPFHMLNALAFSSVYYGMCGLRHGPAHFAKFACIMTALHVISVQVLHCASVLTPNQDMTFATSVMWTTTQIASSSLFVPFPQIKLQWLTFVRYITALNPAIEGLVRNQFQGQVVNCSSGNSMDFLNSLMEGLSNVPPSQLAILKRLQNPPPGCTFKQDVLMTALGYDRPFGVTMAMLMVYLAAVHILTFIGLTYLARKERR